MHLLAMHLLAMHLLTMHMLTTHLLTMHLLTMHLLTVTQLWSGSTLVIYGDWRLTSFYARCRFSSRA